MICFAFISSSCATYGGKSITHITATTKEAIIDTCQFISEDPEYGPDSQDVSCRELRYVEHIESQNEKQIRKHELIMNTMDSVTHTISDGILLKLDRTLNNENYVEDESDQVLDLDDEL